jgi:hypothetical protein
MSLAAFEFRLRNGAVSEETRAQALAAFAGYPIANEPFLLGAVQALAKGDDARGEMLLLEARRRNPRSRITRILLLDRFLRSGRTREAGVEVGALTRLLPAASTVLVPELARMATDPKSAAATREVLRREPNIRDAVLSHLASKKASAETVLALSRDTGGMRSPKAKNWQTMLMRRLIEDGDLNRAYRLWRIFGGDDAGDREKGLYDPAFSGLRGLPPFNWHLSAGSDGAAEASQGSLQITYYGRAAAVFAEQLLLLKPGRYRLQLEAEGDASGEGSKLAWTLDCHGSQNSLVELPLMNVTSRVAVKSADFTIPSGCPGQWLRLRGSPGEFPSEQSAAIRKLQIARLG